MQRSEWGVEIALSVAMLLALSYLFSVFSFHLVGDTSYFLLTCIVASILYPLVLAVTRTRMTFWKGYFALLVILFLAQASAHGVYFFKMDSVHHDEGEAGAVATIFFAVSVVAALLFYPLGFWFPRWFKRQP
jgi:hypothetical protein